MMTLIRTWLHDTRCRTFGCHSSLELTNEQRDRVRASDDRLMRVEDRIDQMIIRRAGPDFLAEALTNREIDRDS